MSASPPTGQSVSQMGTTQQSEPKISSRNNSTKT